VCLLLGAFDNRTCSGGGLHAQDIRTRRCPWQAKNTGDYITFDDSPAVFISHNTAVKSRVADSGAMVGAFPDLKKSSWVSLRL